MLAAKRVINTENKHVGYIMTDGRFLSTDSVKKVIDLVGNLKLTKEGNIRAEKKIPEVRWTSLIEAKCKEIHKTNMINRSVRTNFTHWYKESKGKVLLVEGPREVGKTTEVLKFVYQKYSYIVYLDIDNFERYYGLNGMEDLAIMFEAPETMLSGMKHICRALDLPEYADGRQTVLVLDNIQKSKKMQRNIAFMQKYLNCDIIAINSGIIGNINTTAQVEIIRMEPLSFEEFCYALGRGECLNRNYNGKPGDVQMLWKVYMDVGGYPYAVKEFICGKSRDVRDYQYHIRAQFEMSIEHYMSNELFDNRKLNIFRMAWAIMQSDMQRGRFVTTGSLIDRLIEYNERHGFHNSKSDITLVLAWMARYGMIGEIEITPVKDTGEKIRKWTPYKMLFIRDIGILSSILDEVDDLNEIVKYEMRMVTAVLNEVMRLYNRPKYDKLVLHKAPKVILHEESYKIIILGNEKNNTAYMVDTVWYKSNSKVKMVYGAIDGKNTAESLEEKLINSLSVNGDMTGLNVRSIGGHGIAHYYPFKDK